MNLVTACLIVYYVIGAYVRYCRTLAGFGLSDLDSPASAQRWGRPEKFGAAWALPWRRESERDIARHLWHGQLYRLLRLIRAFYEKMINIRPVEDISLYPLVSDSAPGANGFLMVGG